jgi:hypothetical protein
VLRFGRQLGLAVFAMVLGIIVECARAADVTEVWEGEPYNIQLQLAIDAPGQLAEQLAEELPRRLKERINTSIGIVWRLQTEIAGGPLRHQLLEGLEHFANDDLADAAPDEDKRILVTVRSTPWGYELEAREFDRYVQRWSPVILRTTQQRDALAEQLFELVKQSVSPLARVEPTEADPQLVEFNFRGSDLPRIGPDFAWVEPGDVLQPVMRRTARDGSLLKNGATIVPWTYLEVVEPPKAQSAKEGETVATAVTRLVGRLRSATQRPLAARKGRIEQVAIVLRGDQGDTTVHLQSRTQPDKPLVGYDVLAQNIDEKELRMLGSSDGEGEVVVTPGKSPVQMVFVRSDGVFLARLPVVPGAEQELKVPLPDDDVRLRVSARLSAFREDMIDLVARRNIFITRVRQQIEEKNFEEAHKLLEQLEELPGNTQFNLALDREAQRFRTEDQQVQRRIDHLFTQTRQALGKFLDPQPISELYEELRQAESLKSQASSDEAKPAT